MLKIYLRYFLSYTALITVMLFLPVIRGNAEITGDRVILFVISMAMNVFFSYFYMKRDIRKSKSGKGTENNK
jgi:hypothetical protein